MEPIRKGQADDDEKKIMNSDKFDDQAIMIVVSNNFDDHAVEDWRPCLQRGRSGRCQT